MSKVTDTQIGQFLFEREGKYKPTAIELNGLKRVDKIDFSDSEDYSSEEEKRVDSVEIQRLENEIKME